MDNATFEKSWPESIWLNWNLLSDRPDRILFLLGRCLHAYRNRLDRLFLNWWIVCYLLVQRNVYQCESPLRRLTNRSSCRAIWHLACRDEAIDHHSSCMATTIWRSQFVLYLLILSFSKPPCPADREASIEWTLCLAVWYPHCNSSKRAFYSP